jgi:hypothetical protein
MFLQKESDVLKFRRLIAYATALTLLVLCTIGLGAPATIDWGTGSGPPVDEVFVLVPTVAIQLDLLNYSDSYVTTRNGCAGQGAGSRLLERSGLVTCSIIMRT